jgi:transcription elongation factor Elf1
MDASKLFKGQKLDLKCPRCNRKNTFDASLAFKTGTKINCTGCSSVIELDTTDIRKEADKMFKELKKMFK